MPISKNSKFCIHLVATVFFVFQAYLNKAVFKKRKEARTYSSVKLLRVNMAIYERVDEMRTVVEGQLSHEEMLYLFFCSSVTQICLDCYYLCRGRNSSILKSSILHIHYHPHEPHTQ